MRPRLSSLLGNQYRNALVTGVTQGDQACSLSTPSSFHPGPARSLHGCGYRLAQQWLWPSPQHFVKQSSFFGTSSTPYHSETQRRFESFLRARSFSPEMRLYMGSGARPCAFIRSGVGCGAGSAIASARSCLHDDSGLGGQRL